MTYGCLGYKSDDDIDLEHLFQFIKDRQEIYYKKINGDPRPWSNDYVLNHAKINNIFREQDKTSIYIFEKIKHLRDNEDDLMANILLARFVNRIDVLEKILPITANTKPEDIEKNLNTSGPLLNTNAYRLHPNIGKYNTDKIAKIIPLIHLKYKDILNAIKESNSIEEATYKGNKALGGGGLFFIFQCILDLSYFRPDLIDPKSKPFIGEGGRAIHDKIQLDIFQICAEFHKSNPDFPEILPYNMENALCEYRKYLNFKITNKIRKKYK